MTVQAWTFLLVAASFALYIGIAIWSRAGSTKDFYVAGPASTRSPTAWPPPPTG
jgi:Na+(H+)/acetate symporter ActP